jgi:spore maturation protein CgeB
MRILFLPVYDPSHHAVSVANKHGLRDALIAAGHVVREIDYCVMPEADFVNYLMDVIIHFNPDMVLTQLQGVNYLNADKMSWLRSRTPGASFLNFNQDYWPEHHTTPDMLALLRHVDLQLVSNGSVLPDYAANGVNAAYWPFGYETPVRPLPDVPAHDVVFLGNAYSEHRRALGKLLKSLPYNVGLYGTGWENGDGDCNYDFTYGEALYKKAKIAISDNEFTDAVGYLSNRPFQILAAGGAILLQQEVVKLEEMTGLQSLKHMDTFENLDEIEGAVAKWLRLEHLRGEIVEIGQQFVQECHSYDVRVRELFAMVEGLQV